MTASTVAVEEASAEVSVAAAVVPLTLSAHEAPVEASAVAAEEVSTGIAEKASAVAAVEALAVAAADASDTMELEISMMAARRVANASPWSPFFS